jgi:hypothetical protein
LHEARGAGVSGQLNHGSLFGYAARTYLQKARAVQASS